MGNTIGGFGVPQNLNISNTNLNITGSVTVTGSLDFGKNSDLIHSIGNVIHLANGGTDTNRSNISKYSFVKPFGTLSASLAAAISGDLIWIHAGQYNERYNVLKDGVNLYFDNGATLINYRSNSDNTVFLLGDQDFPGNIFSVNCTISGYGNFHIEDSDQAFFAYGLVVSSTGSNIIFECNNLSAIGCSPIQIYAGNLTIQNSVISGGFTVQHWGGNVKFINTYINNKFVDTDLYGLGFFTISISGNDTGSLTMENCTMDCCSRTIPIELSGNPTGGGTNKCINKSLILHNCTFTGVTSSGVINSENNTGRATASLFIDHCRSPYEFSSSGVTYNITNSISTHYNVISLGVI